MATSSGIIQSFIRDEFTDNKTLDEVRFEALLAYNRVGCGLLRMQRDPTQCSFEDIEALLKDHKALPDSHAVILFDDSLFYADGRKRCVRQLVDEANEEIVALKKNFPAIPYTPAKGKNLKRVMAVTGRMFREHRSDDFLPSLNFYLDILGNTDEVLLAYLDEGQQDQLRWDLKVTLLLLLAQQQHEIDYQKVENRKVYDQRIKRCFELLKALDPVYQARIKNAPEQKEGVDGSPIKYMGVTLVQEFGKELVHWTDRKSKTIKERMGALNEKRLYWVWGSTLIKTVMGLVPQDYYYAAQAGKTMKIPDPYTGNLSWILYYTRFSLNLYLLLKHTIKGRWMNEEEQKLSSWERWQTQWAQRKFSLLNDSLWGTANLVCFFWLKGGLGWWGDGLSVGLFFFDVCVAVWDYAEQQTQYNKEMLQFEEAINQINNCLNRDEEERKSQTNQLKMQMDALLRAKAKCQNDWHFQNRALAINMIYALVLMTAFVLLVSPPFSTIGTVLCFASTVLYNAMKKGLELHQSLHSLKKMQEKYNVKRVFFEEEVMESKRKLLFLEMEKLEAEIIYQSQLVNYQMIKFINSTVLETLVPGLVFSSLVFFPFGMGLGILAGALGLVIAINGLIDAQFKPKEKKELAFFDEKKYDEFSNNMREASDKNRKTKTAPGFFGAELNPISESPTPLVCPKVQQR